MALNAYMRDVEAETQGKVEGSCDQAGREGCIEIYGWSDEVNSPRDAASGLPTGKRQHKPIVITKPLDKSSPLLMNVLVNNENIKGLKLECWRPSSTGDEQKFFTIELINANIAGIRQEQLNNKYPENMQHEVREHVSLTYQKIIWTWEDGGITAEDDWKAPRSA
jgi:type VI secretion system secreted protein Hcp